MKPGIHDLTADQYHDDPAPKPSLSSTVARLLVDRSPLHAWTAHPKLNPDHKYETTPRLSLGDLCHKLLLGAGKGVAVYEGDDWRKKDAREFRDAAVERGEIPVTAPQFDQANKIVDAARAQIPKVGRLEPERVWIAEDFGTWLRAMTDWWEPGAFTVWDYKTKAGSAAPSACAYAAGQMGYDFQQAFYERVVGLVLPETVGRLKFRFIFQEIDPPYALVPVELDEMSVEIARRKVDAAIESWAKCLASDRWPAYGNHIHRVTLPEWRHRDWLEREMEDDAA